jgi:hypothetical protein
VRRPGVVMKLGPAPLSDRVERPFRVPEGDEPDWVTAELAPPAMPWEQRVE